jgi:hypothetical protein
MYEADPWIISVKLTGDIGIKNKDRQYRQT